MYWLELYHTPIMVAMRGDLHRKNQYDIPLSQLGLCYNSVHSSIISSLNQRPPGRGRAGVTRSQTERTRLPIRRSEVVALAGVALAALILATLLLGALSLIATDSSASLFEWARAYLFRNAIKNTLIVAAVATGLGFVFVGLATLATRDAGPVRTILLYGLLIQLATPAPLAALLWRMTLVAGAPGFHNRWRVWPRPAWFRPGASPRCWR